MAAELNNAPIPTCGNRSPRGRPLGLLLCGKRCFGFYTAGIAQVHLNPKEVMLQGMTAPVPTPSPSCPVQRSSFPLGSSDSFVCCAVSSTSLCLKVNALFNRSCLMMRLEPSARLNLLTYTVLYLSLTHASCYSVR